MRKLRPGAETTAYRDRIKIAQNNKCALCGGDFQAAKLVKKKLVPILKPVLDHDHDSGVCRGVLCNNCNGMEGQVASRVNRAKRDITMIEWLENLVAYYKKHVASPSSLIYHTHRTDDQKRLLRNKRARQKRAAEKAAQLVGN